MKRYDLGGFFAAGVMVMAIVLGCGDASALHVLSEEPLDSALAAENALPVPNGARSPIGDAGLWLDEITGPREGDTPHTPGSLPHGIMRQIEQAPVLYLFETGMPTPPHAAGVTPMHLEALGHSLRGTSGINSVAGPTLTVGGTGADTAEDWLFELRFAPASGQQDSGPAPLIPVPEPATTSLLLMGAAGLALRKIMR